MGRKKAHVSAGNCRGWETFSVSNDIFKIEFADAGLSACCCSVNPVQPATREGKPWCREGSSPTVSFILISEISSAFLVRWDTTVRIRRRKQDSTKLFYNVHVGCKQVLRWSGQVLFGFTVFISVDVCGFSADITSEDAQIR